MKLLPFIYFTPKERKGIYVFLITLSLLILIGKYWPHTPIYDTLDFSKYYVDTSTYSYSKSENYYVSFQKDKPKKKNFPFDPNTVSYDSLILLGFSSFGAKNLKNYISKGGRIYDEKKFKEIYGIDTLRITQLNSFISYPSRPVKISEQINNVITPDTTITQVSKIIVDINNADLSLLIKLPHIGKYRADKIIEVRENLGGFLHIEQLVELKIIPDTLLDEIAQYIIMDDTNIQKININTASYKDFVSHPYIDKNTAEAIIKYRKQHGDFQSIDHLSRIHKLKASTATKILPYLTVQ